MVEDISVKEAAELLNVAEKTVHRWIRQGVVPAHRSHGQFRFFRSELEAWASHKKIGALSHQGQGALEESSDLIEAFRRGGIHQGVEGATPAEVFDHLVQRLTIPPGMEHLRAALVQDLEEREELASTGLGFGVAIPHPRHPRNWGLGGPLAAVGYLRQPVDFKSLDGQPVTLVFLLICSTVKGHLKMLAHISHLLNHPDTRNWLLGQPPAEDLLARIQSLLPPVSP
ncbi:MAG: PTS sugar transporter subunit IIA [Deltaproteobacteria bacterium]|nr:PTS sugar transporter subunit IIA [Deltaproteobacteria bacterium]